MEGAHLMRTVIITVGTSLLTNRDENDGRAVRPWGGWRRDAALPTPEAAALFLGEADPAQASAETHTLLRLPLRETDRLAWLHSDTPEGHWCAMVLDTHYQAQGYPGALHRITGLGYHEASFAERGLRTLLARTFDVIDAAGGPDHVTLCATGGFKAEIAYLNLAGLLLGIDVYYIHEQFRELVSLPRLPLDWDMAWVERNEGFLRWIDAEPRRSVEVESRLRADPHLRPLVAEAADGNSYLAPAGDLLYRSYRERAATGPRATWPPASARAPREKDGLSGVEHHRPRGWEGFVARLTELDCVERVHVDKGGHGRGGARPRIYAANPVDGTLGVVLGTGAEELPLCVETTARGEGQLGLVRTYLEHNMKGW